MFRPIVDKSYNHVTLETGISYWESICLELGLGLELLTLVFSLLVRGGRETTAPELSSKATISAGFTNCRYLDQMIGEVLSAK